MTITKQHYISPLVPDSRRRRGVYEESNQNAQRNTEILQDFFQTQNPRLKEIPPLIVTCVPTTPQSQTSSNLVTRNRSKVQHLIDMHIEKRKERRDYFHRNCLPSNENQQVNSGRTRRDKGIEEPIQEFEKLNGCVEESQEPRYDGFVIDEAPVEQSVEVIPNDIQCVELIPNDIKELEKLIEETHALLQAEGVVDLKTIFPNRTYTNDRDILEELEKDLERIVINHQNEMTPQTSLSLNQLEKELNDLIQK